MRLSAQASWLARVLAARDFPVLRLVRDLEIAAEVARGNPSLIGLANGVSDRLSATAAAIAELLDPAAALPQKVADRAPEP
jgi:hypothetical protein